MKLVIIAAALGIALPGVAHAQTAPAPAPEKKMDCCEKMKAEGKECCCKDMGKDGHAEHQKPAEKTPEHKH